MCHLFRIHFENWRKKEKFHKRFDSFGDAARERQQRRNRGKRKSLQDVKGLGKYKYGLKTKEIKII